MLLIGLTFTGGAAALVLRAVAMPRLEAIARLGQIEAYGFAADEAPTAEQETGGSLLDKLASAVGAAVTRRWKTFDETEIRRTLTSAGLYTTSPMTFVGYRALSTVTVPVALLWYLTAIGEI